MTLAPQPTRLAKPSEAALLTVGPRGEIREANRNVHRLLGYQDGTLVGLSIAWLAPPSRHTVLEQLARALERSSPLCVESVFLREDGTLVPVDLTIQARLGRRGQELAVVVERQDDDRTVIRLPRQIKVGEPPKAASQQPASLPPPRHSYIAPKPALRAEPSPPVEPSPRVEPSRREELGEQLSACIQLLAWLDTHLDVSTPEDAVRQRARVRVVLQEATGLLEECRTELNRSELVPRTGAPRRP